MNFKSSFAEDFRWGQAPSRNDATKDDNNFAPDGYSVRVSREQSDPEWDSFLARCPEGHHEQTSLWGEVKGCYGWQQFRIIVSSGNQILGGVQVLTRRFGRWLRIGYVMRGPSTISNDAELIEFILQQLDQVAASEKLAYVIVVPPYNGFVFVPGLVHRGFRKKPKFLPPGTVMTATLLLDLSVDLDKLLAGMRRSTRQNLRRAIQQGVTVREGTGSDVETFRQLMWALCERRGTSPTPPQKDFFENLWRVFEPSGFVKLFVAEFEGHVISAAMTFPFGDTVRGWKIGWVGDNAKICSNVLLSWEIISWAKQNGYRFFDFVQIEEDLARTMQQGDPVDWDSVKGPDNFKVGFGGTPVVLPQPYYRFYHPILRVFAQAGGSKLMESPVIARILGRFWSGMASRGEG